MAKINVLSKEISELIAAGEVIERPSSVIKEIVENSIDAGAKHITVEMKNGGITFMRVIDDGCGIAFDDVPTAFLRHATSKVSSKDDLDNIFTLGFRGEALASVSAISKVEVLSKRVEDEYGTLYQIEGSVESLHEPSCCPNGTLITIRELFYNVPVRQKFMKKDVTEANAISKIVKKIAISHPEISFKLIRDNKMEFNSCGDGELYSAIYAVYGRDFANDLMEVDYSFEGVSVKGYVIKPLYAKANRTFQNFFVNGRYVQSKLCQTALEGSYDNMIMTGKFPACVLMIDVSPVTIDVNIHPAKAEIRFTNEQKIVDAIFFAVKNAMMKNGLIYEFQVEKKNDFSSVKPPEQEKIPEPEFIQSNLFMTKVEDFEKVESELEKKSFPQSQLENAEKNQEPPKSQETIPDFPNEISSFKYIQENSFKAKAKEVEPNNSDENPECKNDIAEKPSYIKVIGEAFKNYIMAEADDIIVLIDKHAAHERVIFERLKSENCKQYSQLTMGGLKVLLSLSEFDAVESNLDRLNKMGFEFDLSQKPYILLTAVPSFLIELNLEEIISEIAENLEKGKKDPQTHIFDDMLHNIACKSAIKANDVTDIKELQVLAEEVYFNDAIRHCPHGRPVMFTLSKNSIERQFKRT